MHTVCSSTIHSLEGWPSRVGFHWQAQRYARVCTHTLAHKKTYTRAHTIYTCARTHTHTQKHTHAHTHTHTHTHNEWRAYARTHPPPPPPPPLPRTPHSLHSRTWTKIHIRTRAYPLARIHTQTDTPSTSHRHTSTPPRETYATTHSVTKVIRSSSNNSNKNVYNTTLRKLNNSCSWRVHYNQHSPRIVNSWQGCYTQHSPRFVNSWQGRYVQHSPRFVNSWQGRYVQHSPRFVNSWQGRYVQHSPRFVNSRQGHCVQHSPRFVTGTGALGLRPSQSAIRHRDRRKMSVVRSTLLLYYLWREKLHLVQ